VNAVIRLGGLMAALFAAVFGAWTAPPWLRWLAGRLRASVSATSAAMRARPRAFAVAALAMVLLAGGGYAGRVWWPLGHSRSRSASRSSARRSPILRTTASRMRWS